MNRLRLLAYCAIKITIYVLSVCVYIFNIFINGFERTIINRHIFRTQSVFNNTVRKKKRERERDFKEIILIIEVTIQITVF